MTTDELIATLSGSAQPVAPARIGRLVWPVLAGAALSMAVLVAWLGLRPMDEAIASNSFWMKAAYTAALAVAGGLVARSLARPAGRPGLGVLIGPAALVVIVALAAIELARVPPREAVILWLGQTWMMCPMRILVLATPIFLGAVVGLRRLAPTRLAAAGAAAGLLAGAAGATIYGLYCQETAAAFVAFWYTLGIAACALAGTLLGPRLLRW